MRVPRKSTIVACVLCVLTTMAVVAIAAAAQTPTKAATPTASASSRGTAFQCKKKYHTAQGRAACFSRLPGASCAHPLEAEKAHATTRGEHQYFKLTYSGESDENGVDEHYSYRVANNNLAMCGAVFKVSRLAQEIVCSKIVSHGHSVEKCGVEYDTKNIQEPANAHGGSFDYYLSNEPTKVGYLVVKARFIHPPWASH